MWWWQFLHSMLPACRPWQPLPQTAVSVLRHGGCCQAWQPGYERQVLPAHCELNGFACLVEERRICQASGARRDLMQGAP